MTSKTRFVIVLHRNSHQCKSDPAIYCQLAKVGFHWTITLWKWILHSSLLLHLEDFFISFCFRAFDCPQPIGREQWRIGTMRCKTSLIYQEECQVHFYQIAWVQLILHRWGCSAGEMSNLLCSTRPSATSASSSGQKLTRSLFSSSSLWCPSSWSGVWGIMDNRYMTPPPQRRIFAWKYFFMGWYSCDIFLESPGYKDVGGGVLRVS